MSADLQAPSGQPGPADWSQKHEDYFWHFARFKVKEKVFQLPIRPFVEGSEKFAKQYRLAEGGSKSEQVDDGRPVVIQLDDVEVAEFEAFLKALLPPMKPPFSKSNLFDHELTPEEWESVLNLSTHWSFKSLRATAIDYLSASLKFDHEMYNANPTAFSESSITFVCLARTYKVSWWLTRSYRRLVQLIVRYRPLTLEEAGSIGHDTSHELQALALRRLHSLNKGTRGLDAEIEDVPLFRAELAALREEEEEKHGSVWRGGEEPEDDSGSDSGNMDNDGLLDNYLAGMHFQADYRNQDEDQAFGAQGYRGRGSPPERSPTNDRGSSYRGRGGLRGGRSFSAFKFP